MSTKIYNGYKLPLMSMQELLAFNQKVREKFEKIKTEKFHKCFAQIAVCALDNINSGRITIEEWAKAHKEGGSHLFDSIFSNVYWDIHDRIRKVNSTRERDPAVDYGADVLYIPCDDCILALFYAEAREYKKCWESFKEVKDYAYWNQTDRPRSITVKDWKKRSDDWDKALGGDGYGIPRDYGFNYTLASTDVRTPRPEDIIKKFPPFSKRLDTLAKEIYASNCIKQGVAQLPQEEQNKWSNMSEHYFGAIDAIRTGKVEDELNKIKSEIEPLLHKKVTREILYENIFKKVKLAEEATV